MYYVRKNWRRIVSYTIGSVEGRISMAYFDPSPEIWDEKNAFNTVLIWDRKVAKQLGQDPSKLNQPTVKLLTHSLDRQSKNSLPPLDNKMKATIGWLEPASRSQEQHVSHLVPKRQAHHTIDYYSNLPQTHATFTTSYPKGKGKEKEVYPSDAEEEYEVENLLTLELRPSVQSLPHSSGPVQAAPELAG
ncbi:hypothetical protein DFH29DRAFT_1070605 [Suillus ampliporus]|nr:hypothetical protein DFH29DRAFT_1070605 [Suillus ampliporus]